MVREIERGSEMTQEELDRIKSIIKKLPGLPWGYYPRGNKDSSVLTYDVSYKSGESLHEVTVKESDYYGDEDQFLEESDKAETVAEFIWESPGIIQSLLDVVEAQQREIERLKKEKPDGQGQVV